MADSDEEVGVRIRAQTSEATSALDQFAERAKESLDKLNQSFNLTTVVSIAAGNAIEDLASHALGMLREYASRAVEEFAHFGEEIEHLQLVIGGSTESVSDLAVALDGIGVSTSRYENLSYRLNMAIKQNADKFLDYGISMRGADGEMLDQQTIISNVIEKLNEYTAGTERNRVGTELLGRAYRTMTDMMRLTREEQEEAKQVAHDFGLEMSSNDVEASHKFNVAMNLLGDAFKGFFVQIGRELVPGLTSLANLMRDMLVPLFQVFVGVMREVGVAFEIIVAGLNIFFRGLEQGWSLIKLTITLLLAMAMALSGDVKGAADVAKNAYIDYCEESARQQAKLEESLVGSWTRIKANMGLAGPEEEKKGPQKGVSVTYDDSGMKQWEAELQRMKDQRSAFNAMTAAEEAAFWRQRIGFAETAAAREKALMGRPGEEGQAASEMKAQQELEAIQHKLAEATQRAQKEAEAEYERGYSMRKDAAKGNAQAELALAEDNLRHVMAVEGTKTENYYRAVQEVSNARRAADKEDLAMFEANTSQAKVIFKDNADALVSIAKATEERMAAEYGAGSKEQIEAHTKVLEAERSASEKHLADYGKDLDISRTMLKGNTEALVSIEMAWLEAVKSVYGEESDQFKEALKKKLEAERAWADESRKIQQDRLKTADQLAKLDTELTSESNALKLAFGQITQRELDDLEIKAVVERQARDMADAIRRRDDNRNTVAERAAAVNQITVLESQQELELTKLRNKRLTDEKKEWDTVFGSITSAFSTAIRGVIQGTQTMEQAFQKMGQSIALSLIDDMVIKPFMAWVEKQLLMVALGPEYEAAQEAGRAAARTAADAAQLAANIGLVASYAAVAGAAGVQSAAAIPLTGWALAPEAGAMDYAAAMSFATLGAVPHEEGAWNIPRQQIALLHPGEAVVPNTGGQADALRAALSGRSGGSTQGRQRQRPQTLMLTIHPDALNMTLSDWFQRELARVAGAR